MMKKFLAMAATALCLMACNGKDNPDTPGVSVIGTWELTSVATKATVGSVNVSVYVQFAQDGAFSLYQKIGEGRYMPFTGTYKLSADNKLSGSYADNTPWGPYDAAMSAGNLVLTSAGGKEVDTYKKIDSIPASVTENMY